MKKVFMVVVGLQLTSICYSQAIGTFADSRDGKVYKTIDIGNRVWMAENLAYLPSISPVSANSISLPTYNVYGYYGTILGEAKATDNYQRYGVLYNWRAAINSCPTGWHLPDNKEWEALIDYYGGMNIAGGKLKENGESGFGALFGGEHHDNSFFNIGNSGIWWSATADSTTGAWIWVMSNAGNNVSSGENNKVVGSSVRCLKNYVDSLPTITTSNVGSITDTSAVCGGNVVSEGLSAVTTRGVCWSTRQNPSITDSKTSDGTGLGSFPSILTGLFNDTRYYVRSYATNSYGTTYGEIKSFITKKSLSCDGTLTDSRDGREYCYKTIGTQTWMVENLAYLPSVSSSYDGSETSPYYYVHSYEGNSVNDAKTKSNYETYGVLYNWEAAKTACPPSWHLPSDAEWITLEEYLGGQDVAGGKMKEVGTAHWLSPNSGATNESGFTALPSDSRGNMGNFASLGYGATSWSRTSDSSYDESTARCWKTQYNLNGHYWANCNRSLGYSVRCLKGELNNLATISTKDLYDISETTAECGGEVVAEGSYPVTTRGVCWSTSHNPTIENEITINGSGIGEFESSITGLLSLTSYYVRAYATNNFGTSYGEEKTFTTIGVTLPVVSTQEPYHITETTAESGGEVLSEGTSAVTTRGVCWSFSQNPTIENEKTINGKGKGVFDSSIIGLSGFTKYYLKAYATNSSGTSYGEEKSFTTNAINLPDIIIVDAEVTPRSFNQTSAFSAGCNYYNQGLRTGTSSFLKVYLSSDVLWDQGDYLLYEALMLQPDYYQYFESFGLTVPASTTNGTWYVLFVADAENNIEESIENNNVTYAQVQIGNTGISDVSLEEESMAYPNPSTGEFILNVPMGTTKIQIFTTTGLLLSEISEINGERLVTCYIPESGVYWIRILGNEQIVTKRIVISKE